MRRKAGFADTRRSSLRRRIVSDAAHSELESHGFTATAFFDQSLRRPYRGITVLRRTTAVKRSRFTSSIFPGLTWRRSLLPYLPFSTYAIRVASAKGCTLSLLIRYHYDGARRCHVAYYGCGCYACHHPRRLSVMYSSTMSCANTGMTTCGRGRVTVERL